MLSGLMKAIEIIKNEVEKMKDENLIKNPENCDHDCEGCGCDCGVEDENLIVLSDEDGNEVVFEWLDTVEYEDECYGVFMPVEDEEDGVVILHITVNDNEEEIYDSIDDDELVNKLFELFKEQNKDNYTFG